MIVKKFKVLDRLGDALYEIPDEHNDIESSHDCNDWKDAIVLYLNSSNVDPNAFKIESRLPHEHWNYEVKEYEGELDSEDEGQILDPEEIPWDYCGKTLIYIDRNL